METTFVVVADPQIGMYSALSGLPQSELDRMWGLGLRVLTGPKIHGLDIDSKLYGRAIEQINELSPAFVVTCGDLVYDMNDADQHEALARVTEGLDKGIPMYWVAGNHDVTNNPTTDTLAAYRRRYGADLYSFDRGGIHGIVINSTVCQKPTQTPGEWERTVEFLEADLDSATKGGAEHIFLFAHHPLFVTHVGEADNWLNIPLERRNVIMDLLLKYGVKYEFAGHWHRNHHAYFGEFEMIATGAVSYPLGPDRPGFRVVRVDSGKVEHEYVEVGGELEIRNP